MALSKNLVQRTVFGALLVAIIVTCVLWCPQSFFVLVATIMAGSVIEFNHLTSKGEKRLLFDGCLFCAVLLFVAVKNFVLSDTNVLNQVSPMFLFCFYGLAVMVYAIVQLFNKEGNALSRLAYFALCQLWIALPCCMLYYLEFYNGFTPYITLACFLAIWSNDTFAYCAGSLFGKHKMFERISPKKTWEGFVGGAVGAMVVIGIFSHFVESTLPLWSWVGLAAVVVVFGTFGDLLESMLKRTLGVKDSGNVIPGHGGMLDRFDSMLLAVPAACIYLYLISFFI